MWSKIGTAFGDTELVRALNFRVRYRYCNNPQYRPLSGLSTLSRKFCIRICVCVFFSNEILKNLKMLCNGT